ncbi:UNVERIFIED_CONTAM: hypothetical protein FKN15_065468 [Acipenser sinensis]
MFQMPFPELAVGLRVGRSRLTVWHIRITAGRGQQSRGIRLSVMAMTRRERQIFRCDIRTAVFGCGEKQLTIGQLLIPNQQSPSHRDSSKEEEVQWEGYTAVFRRKIFLLPIGEERDLIPIIAVLEYNQWFTKLSSKDLKLSADVCEQILRVVGRSSWLEELVLENAGLKTDFAQKLANALALNPCSGLHTINLANNALEDRDALIQGDLQS